MTMGAHAKFVLNEKVNSLTAIKEVGHFEGKQGVYAEYQCECGKVVVKRISYVRQGRGKSCGCKHPSRTHGLSNSPLFGVWEKMMIRCYNDSVPEYPNYGGRGIEVCDRWHDIVNFYQDMVGSYKDGLTLDRTDVNGNYTVENCQWADRSWQAFNTRVRVDNTTGKTGVYFDKERGKWMSRITVNGKNVNLGRYSSFDEAVAVRENAELKYFGRLKHPNK